MFSPSQENLKKKIDQKYEYIAPTLSRMNLAISVKDIKGISKKVKDRYLYLLSQDDESTSE